MKFCGLIFLACNADPGVIFDFHFNDPLCPATHRSKNGVRTKFHLVSGSVIVVLSKCREDAQVFKLSGVARAHRVAVSSAVLNAGSGADMVSDSALKSSDPGEIFLLVFETPKSWVQDLDIQPTQSPTTRRLKDPRAPDLCLDSQICI